MSRRTAAEMRSTVEHIDQLLRRAHNGLLFGRLKILVHLSEKSSKDSPGKCTALCLQYPVHAKAETPEEAVRILLNNLVDYLVFCVKDDRFAPCGWANAAHIVAFDSGERMQLDDVIEASVSSALLQYLGVRDSNLSLESVVESRDISKFQDEAGLETVKSFTENLGLVA